MRKGTRDSRDAPSPELQAGLNESELIYPLGVNTALLSKGRGAPWEAGRGQRAVGRHTRSPDRSSSETAAGRMGHSWRDMATTSIQKAPLKTLRASLAHYRASNV